MRLIALAVAFVLMAGAAGPGHANAKLPAGFYGATSQEPAHAPDFRKMRLAGVQSYRLGIGWQFLQTRRHGGIYWGGLDQDVAAATKSQIELDPYISGAPRWATGCNNDHCAPVRSSLARQSWKHFVGALVNRYGPGGRFWVANPQLPNRPIRHWEIWSEENNPYFFRPKTSPKRYATLLTIASGAIHARDRGATVITGGMLGPAYGPGAITSYHLLRKLYAMPGIKGRFEAVGTHPYAPDMSSLSSQLNRTRRLMNSAGDHHTPIWITEIGWSSLRNSSGLSVGREGQARKLKRAFHIVLRNRARWRVKRLFWYAWRDTPQPGFCGFCPGAGLVTKHLKPKPAYWAYAHFAKG